MQNTLETKLFLEILFDLCQIFSKLKMLQKLYKNLSTKYFAVNLLNLYQKKSLKKKEIFKRENVTFFI